MNKRRLFLIAGISGAALALPLIALAIPFRGWTRAHLAPTMTQVFYGTNTARIFDNEFPPINETLKNYDFALIDKRTLPKNEQGGLGTYEPLHGCYVGGYEGIHETITCQKVSEYKPASPQKFQDQWTEHSQEFADYLEDNGWRKQYADQPSYKDLFNGTQDTGRWLSYEKNHGRVRCHLTVAYNPPYPNPDDQIWIHEQCSREIKFFGGY